MATSSPDFSGFAYSGASTDGNVSASDSTGDQGVLSGLSDIFSSVGSAVAQDVKATQAPRPIGPAGAGLIYNPATGTYVSAYGMAAQSTLSPLILLLVAGVIIWLVVRK